MSRSIRSIRVIRVHLSNRVRLSIRVIGVIHVRLSILKAVLDELAVP